MIKPYIGPARLDRGKCVIRLTKEEIDKGNKMLKKFRIPKNAKIICFSVRDNMYLKKKNSLIRIFRITFIEIVQ